MSGTDEEGEAVHWMSVQAACGYWYACGYNDHRQPGQPYINPHDFAATWANLQRSESRQSLPDAFKLFLDEVVK